MEKFEENLGKFPYVTLADVKDYLNISSDTHNGTLTNAISYATAVVEHYIGQQVLANDYFEVFDGGATAVYVNRLPLNNVYTVAEYNGTDYVNLSNPTSTGLDVQTGEDRDNHTITNIGSVSKLKRIKKFGTTSANFDGSNYLAVKDQGDFYFDTEDFTIDVQVRMSSLSSTQTFLTNYTDSNDFWEFKFNSNALNGLQWRVVENSVETVNVAHGATSGYTANTFHHFAVVRKGTDLKLYRDGTQIGNTVTVAKTVDVPDFTSNVEIGRNPSNANVFVGQMDEIRISRSAQYDGNFTAPEHQHATDDDTVLLIHCDGSNNDLDFSDSSTTTNEFTFARDSGKITRNVGHVGITGNYPTVKNSYPALTLGGPPKFNPYANALKIKYRAGYEDGDVPFDLKMATLDYIKILHKQDQDRAGFSFEGERADKYKLSADFPPHIRRVLELYRIVY